MNKRTFKNQQKMKFILRRSIKTVNLKTDSHIALQKLLFTQVYEAIHKHYFKCHWCEYAICSYARRKAHIHFRIFCV